MHNHIILCHISNTIMQHCKQWCTHNVYLLFACGDLNKNNCVVISNRFRPRQCLFSTSHNYARCFALLCLVVVTWWRHQMETFSALLAICVGNSPVTGEFPTQRPVTRSFDVFFHLRLNKQLSKQSWGWWFETLSRPLWRHRNDIKSLGPLLLTWINFNPNMDTWLYPI